MAGELIISPAPYLTGATIYFQVFSASGQIWDTGASAFETYATASIGDYDIAATELGTASGIYQASMPAAPAGIVSALALRRVGSSPAETDPVVGVMAPRAWTGSAFVDVGDLATASALATTDGKIDGIKAVTDALPDAGALTSLATASALQTVDDNVDAIKAVTDNLPDSGALSSLATASALATASGKVDTANGHLTDIKGGTFNGSTDSLEAIRDRGDAAWTTADVSGLAAKTDLPANFGDLAITETTGRVTVGTNADKTGYALTSAYDAAKTAASATNLAAVKTVVDDILADTGTDGVALSSTTMQAIADALLDRANAIDGATPRAALRYIAAMLAGKVTGAGTGIETFYGLDGTTERLEITVDTDGNRSAVDYDP